MKKAIKFIVSIILIIILYKVGRIIFIKEYTYNYKNNNNEIVEEYKLDNKNHIYNITVKNKKNKFNFTVNHNYHKNKKIVKDIIVYKNKNLICISPIYKDNVKSNILCKSDNKIVSYYYLSKNDKNSIEKVKKYFKKKNYSISDVKIKYQKISRKYDNISYNKNIINNYNLLIWKYNGIFSFNKSKQRTHNFLDNDIYDSKYRIQTTDKLYILDVKDDMVVIDKIYVIDIKTSKRKVIDISKYNISTNSYFNGVYQDNIYLFDCNNNYQYKINNNNLKISISSKDNKIKTFDGNKLKSVKVDSIKNNNIKFNNRVVNKKITKLYNTKDIIFSNNHYYFKDNLGNFYMSFKNDYKNSILLFNMKDFDSFSVYNDTIFGINNDTLYVYDYTYGLMPLIKYSEFNYQKDNMYFINN